MHVTTHLVGASHRPPDAQAVILSLEEGDELILRREPDNAHDFNAIQVIHPETDIHIGYIPAKVAVELAPMLDNGSTIECHVWAKNGKKPSLGLSITD